MTEIPEDIMEAARGVVEEYVKMVGKVRMPLWLARAISDSLLAAEKRGEQRERERCAEVCDAIGDREDGLAIYAGSDDLTPIYRRGERIAMELANAIRNGDPR